MPDILAGDRIPYRDQAERLFHPLGPSTNPSSEQQMVPFLGAGVSISGRSYTPKSREQPNYPEWAELAAIVQGLGLDKQAALFLEVAILIACRLQVAQNEPHYLDGWNFFEQLVGEAYPPSAGELAQLFSELSDHTQLKQAARAIRETLPADRLSVSDEELVEMLKMVSTETGIASVPDPLTSITEYYENVSDRRSLLNNLRFIAAKNTPSRTHKLLAAAAKHYLGQPDTLDDYLIITTNYDCLMEAALDQLYVPYAVVIVRRRDQKVLVRFSSNVPNAERLAERHSGKSSPATFFLSKPKSLVLLYKLHGCISPEFEESGDVSDSVIISESDYLQFISVAGSNQGVIPSYVTMLMQKQFLFLGYSMKDWNIRSILEKRDMARYMRDFAVMLRVDQREKVIFDNKRVQIIETDLNSYVDGILEHLPDELRGLI